MGIRIAVFGAFDINSFGDSLFPKALEIELKKRIELDKVTLFSPTKNCSEYGDEKVYPYEEFEEVNKKYSFDAIIVGGGELLHNMPIEFSKLNGEKIIYEDGVIWKKPLEYGKKYGIKVLINSVGIPQTISNLDCALLKDASYISVRDRYSQERLCGMKENECVKLVPDSLWNLDEYYSVIGDADKKSVCEITGISENDAYVAFQLGTMDNWNKIFETVLNYCQQNNRKLVVFAINWCHADKEVIENIAERYGNSCHVIKRLLQVEEIMSIISSAETFVGTSFHGLLVGYLSGTRVIAYNMYSHFVSKMDGLVAWMQTEYLLVEDTKQLESALNHVGVVDSVLDIEKKLLEIKEALKKHFDAMAAVITGKRVSQKIDIPQVNPDIIFSRSYFEWTGQNGETCYKTIIAHENAGFFEIKENIGYTGDVYWYLPTMSFAEIQLQSTAAIAVNVDEEGRCFEKAAKYCLTGENGVVQLRYRVKTDEISEAMQKLMHLYWNKSAHVELLEEAEREYQARIAGIQQINDTLEKKNTELSNVKIALEGKERRLTRHIEQLLEVEREYEREKKSRTYCMALMFRKISTFFLPVNSKRRFFVKMIAKAIRHPKLMFHMVNIRRIRNFFEIVKKEGMDGINYHYKLVEEYENSKLNPFNADQFEVAKIEENVDKTLEDYAKLSFVAYENPAVSIVIPVYNQFEYTYNCLASILKNSGSVAYEIIIADDCSTDLTQELEKVVDGINVLHNEKNLRFLLNCNNAAKHARGKYILFLNNDTQVQENWLQPLVDILEKDASVGMTGSKLVYSDGHLQEAGGIFWNDASAWNYGNRKNPDDPEFNYVKETDYISGASIMIRASLWNEIGGFDERFAPAYYEDSDLAFEVRKHGYKVVYQPLSVVVHFEGISNGTDLNSGQKAYQVANQSKFYEKWKDVLEKEHFPNGENVFLAKDRSRFKKQILVVDHYVPHYDKDAGGKCTYMYLLMFVKMGFKVTFIGDNFFKHEPYTTDLNQHGIEVLYGNYYFENWQEWLKENLHYFDYVYLQRPHISIKYIDLVKEYSHAKVLYFAHDLHHVREYREYLLSKDEEKLKSSEHWKKIEYELFEKADVGHVVGSYEQGVMQKAFPNKPIRNIPLYIYEDVLNDINKNFKERKDLIYVGGFGHPPNIDAVLWFGKEVFPKVLEKYPDMVWHVVGGKVPIEIQEMASKNIIIEGFLSDEDLHALYRTCRMAVVPLRVGAGVKGKVVEAAYYQIPLVTTTIGAEGLSCEEGNMVVEDDADKMAELICDMYEDYDRLKQMSDAGIEFIQKYFTQAEAERVLLLDVEK